jgi:hypothetical protein
VQIKQKGSSLEQSRHQLFQFNRFLALFNLKSKEVGNSINAYLSIRCIDSFNFKEEFVAPATPKNRVSGAGQTPRHYLSSVFVFFLNVNLQFS